MSNQKTESISFNLFYLTEFFNITLNKIEGKIADSHYKLLKNLSSYLTKEDAVIEGLEKLASHQTTNDLAIFLFDMMEKTEDFGHEFVYKSLPELSEDFRNLYSLMMEDEDSVKSLKEIVGGFQEKIGAQQKEKQLEEFIEMVKPARQEPEPERISFKEFYIKELLLKINDAAKSNDDPEELNEFCVRFINAAENVQLENASYPSPLTRLLITVKELLPSAETKYSYLYNNLLNNAQDFIKETEALKTSLPDEFNEILNTGHIKESVPDKKKSKESDEKPQLNSLLVEYFKSEIEDYFIEISTLLNKPEKELNKEKSINDLIKKLKGLKEVCMIHGYSGLEYVINSLTNEINKVGKNNLKITSDSVMIISDIFDELKNVEHFTDKAHSQKYVDSVKEKISGLLQSFSSQEIVQKEKPVAPKKPEKKKEEIKKEEPDLISVNDQQEFLKIVQSFFEKISVKVIRHHSSIGEAESREFITSGLNLLQLNSTIFHKNLFKNIVAPLKDIYTDLFNHENISESTNNILTSVWKELSSNTLDSLDLESLNKQLLEIKTAKKEKEQPGTADLILFENPRVFEAFLEISEKLWHKKKDVFVKNLISIEEYGTLSYLFNILRNNLQLMEFVNYIPFIDFIESCIKKSLSNPFSKEAASEIEETFVLFFDRIRHQGKDGNCDDITEVLKETLEISTAEAPDESLPPDSDEVEEHAEEEKPQEEIKEGPATESEEKDDVTLFKEETIDYLKIIDENLKEFSKTRDRKKLNKIETACHSVRSAAHFLNLQDISKLAATIEEAAELFGQSELPMPDNLGSDLRIGIQTLENLIANPNTEFSATLEMMESLLDHIVIEDMGGKTKEDSFKIDEDEIQIVNKPDIEEKPLFSGDSVDDEDLQEIFKEESNTFLTDIHTANEKLLNNPDDEKAAKALGYASHSLKSAAKMLGFSEISEITDILEKVTDAIYSKNISHSTGLYDKIEEAIVVLRNIAEGNSSLNNKEIKAIITGLEPAKWVDRAEEPSTPVATPDEKIIEQEDVEEEEEEKPPANMIPVFVEEATQLLEELNRDYLELEKLPESDMILANVLRNLHTLKGSAYISKFNLIGDIAHKLEDFFEIYKEKDSTVKNEMLNSAFISVDIITDMVASVKETGSEKINNLTTRLAEVDNKLFLFQSSPDTPVQDSGKKEVSKTTETTDIKSKKNDEESILKISTEYMDKLVDMASELMINQTQLGSHLHTLKEVLSDIEGEKKQINSAENIIEDAIEFGVLSKDQKGTDSEKTDQVKKISENIKDMVRALNMIHSDLNALTEGFEQNIGRISSISKLLHSDMLKTRMVPVDNLFNRYPRAVRDLAQKQKKKVNLVIEDNNTEMDRAMVEGLAEPILHIIRNAIDHGIETPEERKAINKSETGTLLLKAHQEKNQIVINIEDDGRGLDIDAIKSKIIEKELAPEDQVKKMSVAEALDYIFYPGFTTKDIATDISGRGIGLDAVSNQIQKLKGNIRIKTEKNVGTSFNLRVPLTLVISQALMVKVNLQTVAIPVIAVQESIQFNRRDIINDDNKHYVRVRGRLLPFMLLKDIMKFSTETEPPQKAEQMAVVIFDAGISMALGIDEVVGRQEVVIKSLGSHLQNVDYISGGTILANGDVALILDYALVIRTVEMHYFGKMAEKQISKTSIKKTEIKEKEEKTEKTERPDEEKEQTPAEPLQTRTYNARNIKQKAIKGRKPVVIVVDDSNSVRNFVGSILERNGFVIIKSTNGADALEKMKTEEIDLVITDLEMPKMHGFDLISNIRNQKKNDELPIIILTGRAGMKHRQTGEELGANAFIVKPFKEKDLLQSLEQFIKIG
jgi:chemosensory pili system protein ChpA (sensor histidine kinase/response regulator)